MTAVGAEYLLFCGAGDYFQYYIKRPYFCLLGNVLKSAAYGRLDYDLRYSSKTPEIIRNPAFSGAFGAMSRKTLLFADAPGRVSAVSFCPAGLRQRRKRSYIIFIWHRPRS